MEIEGDILKILCYLNYINYSSLFDKRKNVITNHENIFLK